MSAVPLELPLNGDFIWKCDSIQTQKRNNFITMFSIITIIKLNDLYVTWQICASFGENRNQPRRTV